MREVEWSYEVPPAGSSAEGLEEYVVTTAGGEPVGKVMELLRHGDELFLVVERGAPPARHEPRLVAWGRVGEVDHDALTVVLAVTAGELDDAPALDPGKGVEAVDGDASVDAVRVTELPGEVRPRTVAPGNVAGPTDRPTYAASLLLGGVGLFALLVAVIVVTLSGEAWTLALFAVPAFLLAAAAVLGYRTWRLPYERPG